MVSPKVEILKEGSVQITWGNGNVLRVLLGTEPIAVLSAEQIGTKLELTQDTAYRWILTVVEG